MASLTPERHAPRAQDTLDNPSLRETSLRSSIIIVNYNAGEKILSCLRSVSAYLSPDDEILVVDNASSDGMANRIIEEYPEIRMIRSDINLGFGGGCNLGARAAGGGHLVFLNPDTVVENGWLEGLLAPLEGDSDAGLSTSRILLLHQPDRINTCGNTVHITGLTLCRGLGLARNAFNEPGEVDAVSGAAFAIRRDLFESLEGFDEDTFLYVEDTDLSWRARLAGWRTVYSPASTVLHDYALKITPRKIFYQERNRYLMLLKSLRWPTLFLLSPALLLAEVIAWAFVLSSDSSNWRNKLEAYQWVVKHWGRIRRKRKATQQARRVKDRKLLQNTSYKLDFRQGAKGVVASAANFVFNPIFFILRTLILIIVRW